MQLDELQTLMIVKSLGVNYPIISEIGYAPAKVITLAVSEYQTRAVCSILENYEAAKITDFMTLSSIMDMLCNTNSECVLIPYSSTRRGKEILQFVKTAVQMGCIGDKKLRALPVLISETRIRGCDTENLFVIYLQGDLSCDYFSLNSVVPPDEQAEVVFDKIRDINPTGRSAEEKALLAASCFLYPYMKKHDTPGELEELFGLVADLVEQDDNNGNPYEACGLFLEELYIWQEKTQFCDVHKLPDLKMSIAKRIDEVILFNDQYVYMGQQFFEQISQALLGIFSSDIIKSALADEGILCPDSSKTYTAKVGYRNIVGGYKRVRMLRFRREKLNKAGELDFVELCLNWKGDRRDDD